MPKLRGELLEGRHGVCVLCMEEFGWLNENGNVIREKRHGRFTGEHEVSTV